MRHDCPQRLRPPPPGHRPVFADSRLRVPNIFPVGEPSMKKARRDILKAGTAGTLAVGAAGALGLPLAALAQPKPVRIGVLHPVTGPLAYSGQQCREGALMAIEAINQA